MKTAGFIIFFIGISIAVAQAQSRRLDSLARLEKTYLTEDTVRVKLLTDLARGFYSVNPAQGLEYADKAIALGEKLSDKKYLAGAYSAKGTNKMAMADYATALDFYQKALAINARTGNKQGIANNYNNIGLIYYSVFDYPRALEYYQKTLALNEQTGNQAGIINVLGNIGNIHNELRDYAKAIEYYQKALEICEKTGNTQALSGILVNIGNVYTQLADYPKALEFKQKALAISEKQGNKARIAINLGNIGNVYLKMADYSRALEYHRKALEISESIQDKQNMAASLAGIGAVYQQQQHYAPAVTYIQKARDLARGIGQLNTESQALERLSQIYEATQRYDSAYLAYRQFVLLRDSIDNVEVQKQITRKTLQYEFSKTEDSLKRQQLLTDAKLNEQILLAAKQQQELLIKQNAIDLANKERSLQHLAFLKTQAELHSAQSENKVKAEQLARSENEKKLQATQVNLQQTQLELKDKALQAQKTQRNFYLAGLALLALLSFFIYRNYKNQQKSNGIISLEKKKSDDLLLNILPREVADELKEKGRALAKQYNEVTVLFTDFVDFTVIAENRTPQELVNELHECFKTFDEIIERHGLEKIKTIGDAYMAVSGLPLPDTQHARKAALAALDIQQYVKQRQRTQPDGFDIRIGLHSGPVVAGIVGVKKFAYDIWGDTVNTAARMESSSEPGRINISGATYALLKNDFNCVYRGKVSAKNKGDIDMYFLT
ncbi:MAG: tetratricopeptide repeat protein [Thermoanaerobaculia bacterium]|nr:tetratricopeptide repeat protein [Thermoanaerobaculia bacterium]